MDLDYHETPERILGIDILVRTNENKDKVLRISNISGFIGGYLCLPHEDVPKEIKIDVECLGYSYEVIPIDA